MLQTEYFNVKEHTVAGSHIREYPASIRRSQDDILYMHVKQYTPKWPKPDSASHPVTLIAAHGVGFPKELYEPLWDEMYRRSSSNGYWIRGIWIADAVNQGQSGIINEYKLSDDYSWTDHARDLLMIINHFREEMPRPMVGIGHSAGGNQITNLAFMHPRLFTSVILLDPCIQIKPPPMGFGADPVGPLNYSAYSNDIWPNGKAAARQLRKALKKWDPRVVDLMLKYNFRALPTAAYPDLPPGFDAADPPVTTATAKLQSILGQMRENFDARQPDGRIRINRETHADMEPLLTANVPLYRPEPPETFRRMPSLRPSALWVLAEKTFFDIDHLRAAISRTGTGIGGSGGVAEGRVREILLPKVGHQFPFTAVAETSDACAAWLGTEMNRFRQLESQWEQQRAQMPASDHVRLSKKWMDTIKPPAGFKTKI